MNLTIVSLCDDNRREISDVTAPTVEEFSKNTGARFVRHTSLLDPSLHAHWNKFIAVERELAAADWVMWLDADIPIIDTHYDLSEIVRSAEVDMLFSTDFNGICAGAFLMRNCSWSFSMIKTCLFLREVTDKIVREQNNMDRPHSDQDSLKVLMNCFPLVNAKFGFIPQDVIQNPHSQFNPKAFAVHYWAAFVQKHVIFDKVAKIRAGEWSESCLKDVYG